MYTVTYIFINWYRLDIIINNVYTFILLLLLYYTKNIYIYIFLKILFNVYITTFQL